MSDSRPPPQLSDVERSRIAAVDQYVALGEGGIPELLAMLSERSWVVRRSAIAGLSALGEPAVPGLIGILRHGRDDEDRLAAAVDALSTSIGAIDAAIIELMGDQDIAVVCDAAQILGRRRVVQAIPALEGLVAGKDDNAAVAAIEALGRIGGTAALESLVRAARSHEFFRVFPAIDVLGRTGDPRAVGPLAELLDEPLYAHEAARALGRTGESAAVVPLARLLLRDGTTSLRIASVALAELHDHAELRHGTTSAVIQALEPMSRSASVSRRLIQGLRDADPLEKAAICTVLGTLGNEESVATLVTLVESPAPVGPAAKRALARLGQLAQPELLHVLRLGMSAQRLAVLPFVTGAGAEDRTIECLKDPDPAVRALACRTLARLGNSSRVAPLFSALEDPDPVVVQSAIAAIQTLGGPETEMLALGLARSGVEALRRSAIRILAYFGYPSAFDVLFVSLGDPDPRVRDTALNGLGFVDDDRATQALLNAARSPIDRVRSLSMKSLGHRTPEARVVACLDSGLSDQDAWVRYYACQSLGRLTIENAAERIAELLHDDAGQVRVAAVEALARIGGGFAHGKLLEAAESKDEDVRRASLIGLGLAHHPEALRALLDSSRASDPMTRLFAVSALSVLDAPEVLPALLEAARDPDDAVRRGARECLATRSGEETTRALIEALDASRDPEWIVTALSYPVEGRVRSIMSALANADERLARHLVSILGRMGTSEATGALVSAMALPSVTVRKVAAPTLGALATPDALAVLERVAREDADFEVRRVVSLLLPV